MLLTVSTQPEDMNAAKAAFANVSAAAAVASNTAAEPITLDQAKMHLHVVGFDEDSYISGLITAARQMAEGRLNRTLLQRQLVTKFYARDSSFYLPRPPVVSVDTVSYVDNDGAEQIVDVTGYRLEGSEVPRLFASRDATWPHLLSDVGEFTVRYTAGYAEGEVPQPIIQWMLLVIAAMFAHRESMTAGVKVEMIPEEFNRWLLQPYMVYE